MCVIPDTSTNNQANHDGPTKLKRSNSASTLLGLSVLLYPDSEQYLVATNNYYGFKVKQNV